MVNGAAELDAHFFFHYRLDTHAVKQFKRRGDIAQMRQITDGDAVFG